MRFVRWQQLPTLEEALDRAEAESRTMVRVEAPDENPVGSHDDICVCTECLPKRFRREQS